MNTRRSTVAEKLRTMAQQIASARGKGVFDDSAGLFDRLDEAGDRIEDDAIMAEVESAIEGEDQGTAELEAALLSAEDKVDNDDALAQLKAKMAGDKEAKQLAKAGDDDSKLLEE